MNSYEYIPLSTWLSNSDMLYLDGRLLWLQVGGVGGSFMLLWLSVEQIMKTLVFQYRIQASDFNSNDGNDTLKQFDKWGIEIGHNLNKNLMMLNKYYPNLLLNSDINALEKIYEYFNRRYVTNSVSGIPLSLLRDVDNVYFKLRDQISEDLPASFIDEIALRKENNEVHILEEYMKFAYLQNNSFRKRHKYRV